MVMTALTSELLANLTDPQIDAMVEAMLLAATADGELDDTELAQLRHSLLNVDDMWLSHIDLDQRIATARQHLAGHTRAERLAALQLLLDKQEQRVAALELAALVMTSDGIIRTSERDLMLEAAEALGVDSAVAADIMAHVGKSVG
jgi:tellurite resistance protein